MAIEQFLQFWSRHNTLIIEVLVGLILLSLVYLAFRHFFGQEEELSSGKETGNLDVSQLEKTLQKILESHPGGAASGLVGGAGASASVSDEELQKLRLELSEKERLLEELKAQASSAPSVSAEADNAFAEEKKKLEDKIHDLEARLAEYEIISEDIADLSFYKEENSKLQKELESLKVSSGSAPMDLGAGGAPPAAASSAEMPTPASSPEDDLKKQLEANAETSQAAPAADAPAPASAAAPAGEAPAPGDDSSQLMNQFENFVKKG